MTQQRINPADVSHLDLDEITKVIEEFENPKLPEENFSSPSAEDLATTAESVASSLHQPVKIISSESELPEDSDPRMRSAKGWYDTQTGQVVVYLPNATSPEDVTATILHELIGHKAVRDLIGSQNFDSFLDQVYNSLPPEARREIDASIPQHGSRRIATEEYIARLAESDPRNRYAGSLWAKVKTLFRDLLARLRFALALPITNHRACQTNDYKPQSKRIENKLNTCYSGI